jgi:hypothetical protein
VFKRYFGLCLLICCLSCSPFSALRKRAFGFTTGDEKEALRIKVPKRYARMERVDSAGSQQQWYRYSNGAFLYVIHTTDTVMLYQPIDTARHIPLPHPYGGVMYKGQDSAGHFWREIRTDSFRFGYRFVPHEQEVLFDSAVNYAGKRRYRK